ncbi:hypothetical protein P154DRAFT_564164 [Amniculicola lignicola CBS 123094]|uniref:Uncharacterized protein n=1 Tax=Amniculicola lignicola CBS 123094 TaxID=1392246 RepID=A0A6A5WCP4_9PLEO|nr:hypothetical protein P154DRAFT_564164 [Amniculicola lignicola CBS 123094]
MAPLGSILTSLLSLTTRQRKFPDHITVQSEPSGVCRSHADLMGDYPFGFGGGTKLNVSCWTLSSMLNDDRGRYGNDSSFIWAWVDLDPNVYKPENAYGRMGIGNLDKGGKAGGYGCYVHEHHIMNGSDIYLPDRVQWCGDAPHHQVTGGFYNTALVCRNCTDLADAKCQKQYTTDLYGFSEVGCWKKGTAMGGNTTWVQLIEPGHDHNCWLSPDQIDPTMWHGPPAPKCKS